MFVREMQRIARLYPCQMGDMEAVFITGSMPLNPQPYQSYGNGSAMRMSTLRGDSGYAGGGVGGKSICRGYP